MRTYEATKMLVILCVLLFPVVLATGDKLITRSGEVILETRQSFSCNNNRTLCLPDGITSAPQSLVDCVDNVCFCDECFENGDEGPCVTEFLDECYYYDSNTASCQDDRRSQLVAFLLSIFLSGVGAANFYIGQNGLAAGQLSLLVAMILITCCALCIPCCLVCCVMGEDAKGSVFAILFFFLVIIIVLALSFAMLGWWIADAVIFGTNARDDGDGCPLEPWS